MSYEATAIARTADDRYVRQLAGPRLVATMRAGRAWCRRNAETWRSALDDAESGFGVIVTNGEIALLIAHDRQCGSAWVETKSRID